MASATHFAVNPATGERLALINGQWVPATAAAKGQAAGAPKLTEAQAKDGFNARRMTGASKVINPMEAAGYDAGAAALVPGFLPMTGKKRQYESSQLEWADSLLRMTTGAAATKDEIENTKKTYFPTLGDNEAVRKQKAAARARVEQDALRRAGPGGMDEQGALENPFDLSGGQSRSTIPRGKHYKDPEGNIRLNENLDAGNPIVRSAKRAAPAASPSGYRIISVED